MRQVSDCMHRFMGNHVVTASLTCKGAFDANDFALAAPILQGVSTGTEDFGKLSAATRPQLGAGKPRGKMAHTVMH